LNVITTGPDGKVWFTEGPYNTVGKITPSGTITQYVLPVPNTSYPSNYPNSIAVGSDSALWFTESASGKIGRITTAGAITEYPLSGTDRNPQGITLGPDGAMWFVDNSQSKVGRITTTGAITEFALSTPSSPISITTGSDGALWFTEYSSNKIGRITTAGVVTKFSIPTPSSGVLGITAGPDGALWFTEQNGLANNIGRITTAGVITEYAIPSPNAQPWGITVGPDNAVWFTESSYNSSKIGRIEITPADTTPPVVSPNPDRQPNANNWYDADVTVTWSSTDPSPSSGVPTVPSATLATQEGTHTYTSDPSCDPAGNCATGSITLSIDKTNPSITYQLSPVPNLMGWNNTQVAVSFTCTDDANANQSGIDSCTEPEVVPTGNGTFIVEGTAVDKAGNTATTSAVVSIDDTTPDIDHVVTPAPNVNGWNTTDVTVSFTCTDNLSLIFSCPGPEELVNEGTNQSVVGIAQDNAGNLQTENVVVNIDKTAPTLGMFAWSANPKPLTSTATLTVPATDATSGLDRAEYYIGATDPGLGNGMTMTFANQQTNANGAVISADLNASFDDTMATGKYDIHVRTQDKAGHWSAAATGFLTVYDATGPANFAAAKQLRPVFGVDVLPGLIEDGQKDKVNIGFDVAYTITGTVSPLSWVSLEYETGKCGNNPQNCHTAIFTGNMTAPNVIDWFTLTDTNNSVGTFEGVGTLVIDGVATQNPFRVTGTDASRTPANDDDSTSISIYSPNADPSTADSLYELHVNENGNWLTIN
jgi:streptogramin lyase